MGWYFGEQHVHAELMVDISYKEWFLLDMIKRNAAKDLFDSFMRKLHQEHHRSKDANQRTEY